MLAREGHRIDGGSGMGAPLAIAPLWKRAIGGLVDLLLTWVMTLLVSGLFGLGDPGAPAQDPSVVGFQCSQRVSGASVLIALAPAFLLLAAMEWRWGKTPGKRLVGARVVGKDGRPPTLVAALVRNLLRYVDILCLYAFGLAVIAITPRNQRMGDVLARTLVVDDPPAAEPPAPESAASRAAGVGCGLVALLVGLVVLAVLGSMQWNAWRTGGVKEAINAEPWQAPEDGVLRAERLEAFIGIRRRLHEVISESGALDDASLSSLPTLLLLPRKIRRAEAEAQANVGMADAEYLWVLIQVARTLPALEVDDVAFRMNLMLEARSRFAARGGGGGDPLFGEDPPEANVELVRRHLERLEASSVPPALVLAQ
jgi:uncharacterized RDD family membrane protein YckC